MQIVQIVGAGGIGCAVGHALRSAGVEVIFIESNPRKIDAGRREGVAVAGRPPVSASFVAFADWAPQESAVILLCTKCYDNPAVLERVPARCTLIPIQNGFDRRLEAHGHVLEGIASFVSECEPDRPSTRITRAGDLHLGPRQRGLELNPAARQLADAWRRAKLFRVIEVEAIEPYKYAKLMYNAAISPLATTAGIDNGKLLSVPLARQLFFAFLQENYDILSEARIDLGRIGPFHPKSVMKILQQRWLARLLARAFEPSLRGTYCSMALDLHKGMTEVDNYNQRLVELAEGRPCPFNRTAVSIIKRMQKDRSPPQLGVLQEFARLLPVHRRPSRVNSV